MVRRRSKEFLSTKNYLKKIYYLKKPLAAILSRKKHTKKERQIFVFNWAPKFYLQKLTFQMYDKALAQIIIFKLFEL